MTSPADTQPAAAPADAAPVDTAPAPACPDCRAPLTGAAACPACDLPLVGPSAARLWEVDVELSRLASSRSALLAEREQLLHALRTGAPDVPSSAAAPFRDGTQATWAAPGATAPGTAAWTPPRAPRQEWTPERVQNLLLLLGGLLLATAATVFAAVTYDRLGAGGRAAVLIGLTVLAGAAAPRLRARGLDATAETVAAVTLALAALDAYGLRRLGLGADLDDATWLAATSGALALLSGGYAAAVPLRLPRAAAVVLTHAALLLAVVRLDPSSTSTALLLTLIAGLDLAAVAVLLRHPRSAAVRDLLAAGVAGAGTVGALAVGLSLVAVVDDGREAALALAACAALAAGGAVVSPDRSLRALLGALPVPLLAGAAVVLAADAVVAGRLPLVVAAVALAALLPIALLPLRERTGPVAGALVTAAAAGIVVLEHVAAGLAGPLGWLGDPWSLPEGIGARAALSPELAWQGTAVVLGVLAVLACVAAGAGALLDRPPHGATGAGALAAVATLLVPVALDVPHPVALLLLLVLATALLAGADALCAAGRRAEGSGALATAGAAAALAAAWSLADQGSTLAVLPVVGLLLAAAAVRPAGDSVRAVAAGLAGAVAGAELVAAGAARDLAAEQLGGLLLLVPAALLVLCRFRALGAARRTGAEVAAAALTGTAVLLAVADAGWLSWTLAAAGLLALATSLAPDRRALAPVGGLLLTASTWVRLADAGVGAPEPYVLPLAALALLLGHLRFQRDDRTASQVPSSLAPQAAGAPAPSSRGTTRMLSSQAAYGPGLALLLLPSLTVALGESGLTRPLLLGATALVVVLVGAQARLQAPLLLGGGTLALVALDLLAPYASAVPRWTALAAVGTLLVVVGATFEQRRREVAGLRERYAALR